MNGITIRDKPEVNIEEWEIAFDYQLGFIGKVIPNAPDLGPDDGWITMCPVFTYISNPNIQPMPDGTVKMNPNVRILVPMEFMASHVPERFRPTRRRRLADYDKDDQRVFERSIREALDNCDKLRAQRSNLAVVKEIPRGLTKPGGPGGRPG